MYNAPVLMLELMQWKSGTQKSCTSDELITLQYQLLVEFDAQVITEVMVRCDEVRESFIQLKYFEG